MRSERLAGVSRLGFKAATNVCNGWKADISSVCWKQMTTRLRNRSAGVLLGLCTSAPAFAGHNATYSSDHCGVSPVAWSRQGSEFGELLLHNRINVAPQHLSWNGRRVTARQLRSLLTQARQLNPLASMQVVFRGDVGCRRVRLIRQDVTKHLRCGAGQTCVEYSYSEWKRTLPPH